jgi:hypothetical protein
MAKKKVKSTENTKETNKMKVEDKVGEPETVN